MFGFPAYPKRPHKSGQARVYYRGRHYYLGKFDSEQSRKEYARLARQFGDDPAGAPPPSKLTKLTIEELTVAWAQTHKGTEANQVMAACRPLNRLYGDRVADDFGVGDLESLRDALVSCSWMNKAELADRAKRQKKVGWSRNHVKHQIVRIRRIFRWAERRGHVREGKWHHLCTLPPLDKTSPARKNTKRKPVPAGDIERTLPHCPPLIQAMIIVQEGAGLRPSELCRMTVKAIQIGEEVWAYRLDDFKTKDDETEEWQLAMIGPQTQAILRPWLDAAARTGEETPIWRYGVTMLKEMYPELYNKAIGQACRRANVPKWTPYQLRHTAKRRVERVAGEQGARAFLRQRAIESTRMYADSQDIELAKKIAKEIG